MKRDERLKVARNIKRMFDGLQSGWGVSVTKNGALFPISAGYIEGEIAHFEKNRDDTKVYIYEIMNVLNEE